MDKDRLVSLVESFGEVPVFVVGDIGLDEYTDGTVDRISPEAPVPVLNTQHRWEKLGLAGNVAENIMTLGGEPHLFSLVGEDHIGERVAKLCEAKGIVTYLEKDAHRQTTFKHRIMSGNHHFIRIDDESTDPVGVDHCLKILHAFEYALIGSPHAVVIVQDYAKGLIGQMIYTSIADSCAKKGIKLLVDPNIKRLAHYYPGCFMLTPNQKEAEALSGMTINDESSAFKAGRSILEKTKARFCAITRGDKGMLLLDRDDLERMVVPTFAKAVFDVSGAGDTVIAAMALALSVGANVPDACMIGNIAAGIVVGKVGTAIVTREELIVSIQALF